MLLIFKLSDAFRDLKIEQKVRSSVFPEAYWRSKSKDTNKGPLHKFWRPKIEYRPSLWMNPEMGKKTDLLDSTCMLSP